MADKKKKDLGEQRLKRSIGKIIKETLEEELERGNHIAVGFDGVSVHSSQVSMQELVAVVDYMIKKHSRFMLVKKQNKIATGIG